MKCILILIFPLIPWIIASAEIDAIKFEECNPDEWVLTAVTIQYSNYVKFIQLNITYNQPSDNMTYTTHITIDNCQENSTTCTGQPKIWVESANCNLENVSKELYICKVAKEAAKISQELQPMDDIQSLYDMIICFVMSDTNVKYDSDSNMN